MRMLSVVLAMTMMLGILLASPTQTKATEQTIVLSENSATLNGTAIPEYDYTWHLSPDAPDPHYTGTKAEGEGIYIDHAIEYYPMQDQSKFQKVQYDGDTEWVSFYEAEGYEKYIFSTLPALRTGFPSQMMHTPEEAYENPVLHITQPGTYVLEGKWNGQIRVDLGEDAFDDPTAKVKLVLNGVDINCTVAAGILFANVYECDNGWEDRDDHSPNVDTTEAGATVFLAEGTVNSVSGTNIFRLLKPQYKKDAEGTYPEQKKRLKIDGAFYSYHSLNIDGSGTLNIQSGFEGLNSELHLTLNGGNVNIYSQDDGINVNEDDVSVLTVNGGSLHICAGLGAEGDGVDSNGYLVVNGGTVISSANPAADSGLDSDCGSYVNGGTVVSLGSAMDWAKADSKATQAVMNMRFAQAQDSGEAIIVTDEAGKVVFAYDPDKDEVTGSNRRTYSGAVLSAPGLQVGGTYQVYVGGDVTGTETAGVYDASTVTGFTGASRQCWSGTAIGGHSAGNFGNFRPDNMEGMERPDNMGGKDRGENGPPEGMDRDNMTPPEGMDWENMTPPDGFGGFGTQTDMGATCTNEQAFTLSETVNAFSNVSDLRHDLQPGKDGYTCTVCGDVFADEAGTQLIAKNEPATEDKTPAPSFWGYVLAFLAGAAITAIPFTIVLIKKRRAA